LKENNRLEQIRHVLTGAMIAGASEVLRVKTSGELTASYKDATELVTAADQASDTAIRKVLESSLPSIDAEITIVLEESGGAALPGDKEAGADPLDGTNPFACGSTSYSVQAHYMEEGSPQIGVLFQPELFLPVDSDEGCMGRLTWAIRGSGAFQQRSRYAGGQFAFDSQRAVKRNSYPETQRFVACIPLSARMRPDEKDRVLRILDSGLISVSTGVGAAGANIMMTIFGGQQVYANFGAGLDLDLIPPQVIAEEAGLTVWDINRERPRWATRKQPVIVAPNPRVAELFLHAAGY
jgi:3'-phosphoadenosine 5'-phosphosulfate (PAPS) 3'-phosphatase